LCADADTVDNAVTGADADAQLGRDMRRVVVREFQGKTLVDIREVSGRGGGMV
jgi:hypothetical protein